MNHAAARRTTRASPHGVFQERLPGDRGETSLSVRRRLCVNWMTSGVRPPRGARRALQAVDGGWDGTRPRSANADAHPTPWPPVDRPGRTAGVRIE